jgi:hypothetical protein
LKEKESPLAMTHNDYTMNTKYGLLFINFTLFVAIYHERYG